MATKRSADEGGASGSRPAKASKWADPDQRNIGIDYNGGNTEWLAAMFKYKLEKAIPGVNVRTNRITPAPCFFRIYEARRHYHLVNRNKEHTFNITEDQVNHIVNTIVTAPPLEPPEY